MGRLGIDSDEAADLSWETQEGCSVSARLDYLSNPPRRKMTAFGEKGTIGWNGLSETVKLAPYNGPIEISESSQSRNQMFFAQAEAFINSVKESPNSRLATSEDGVKALAVCDTARKASESHREEEVAYP